MKKLSSNQEIWETCHIGGKVSFTKSVSSLGQIKKSNPSPKTKAKNEETNETGSGTKIGNIERYNKYRL